MEPESSRMYMRLGSTAFDGEFANGTSARSASWASALVAVIRPAASIAVTARMRRSEEGNFIWMAPLDVPGSEQHVGLDDGDVVARAFDPCRDAEVELRNAVVRLRPGRLAAALRGAAAREEQRAFLVHSAEIEVGQRAHAMDHVAHLVARG